MTDDATAFPVSARRAAQRIQARIARQPNATVFTATIDTDEGTLLDGVNGAEVSIISHHGRPTERPLGEQLAKLGLTPEFQGTTVVDGTRQALAILRGPAPPPITPAPASFRAAAVLVVYNEEDVLGTTIGHLVQQGLAVYLIDNWSTDETLSVAQAAAGPALLGWERFPAESASPTFDWGALLRRVEQVSTELEVDWILVNDADEIRLTPWPGVSLRDALWHVQDQGFNAVNYSTLNFALTAPPRPGPLDLERQFPYFDPQRAPDLYQLNTWQRQPGRSPALVANGRHRVEFDGVQVFPYNFLLKHYPIRSVEQGLRKINRDRLARYRADERLREWHSHYRRVDRAEDLLVDPASLQQYDDRFAGEFLLERLTGIGFEPVPTTPSLTLRTARLLRRLGVLDQARRLKWRLTRPA